MPSRDSHCDVNDEAADLLDFSIIFPLLVTKSVKFTSLVEHPFHFAGQINGLRENADMTLSLNKKCLFIFIFLSFSIIGFFDVPSGIFRSKHPIIFKIIITIYPT